MNKIILFIFSGLTALSGCSIKIPLPTDSDTFYRVTSSDQRVKDPAHYFKDEYKKISEKRKGIRADLGDNVKPEKLLGLGLSGGGIRSSAYQLGILAGLHQTKLSSNDTGATALDRTDYISCVSGGCWATGAFLIANEPTDEFYECLSEQALEGKVKDLTKCGRAEHILRNDQNLELIGKGSKEEWENDIKNAYFPEECKDFEFADRDSKCWGNLKNKPNAIFNVTHSTLSPSRYEGNIGNLPFQITPDQLGTIADCGSKFSDNSECGNVKGSLAGAGKVGFFVRQDANDFAWVRRERSGSSLWLLLESNPGSQLSKVMAHSSAVLGGPVFLSFSMGLTYKEQFPSSTDNIRDNYFLTDGGFVENLGLISLIERGVDLIVLSDMGYPEREGDDLKLAIHQVKKLLNCNVTGNENLKNTNLVTSLHYSCPNTHENAGIREGTILYLRPYPNNIEDFKNEISAKQPELFGCIEEKTHKCYGEKPISLLTDDKDAPLDEKYRFPKTETMLSHYDNKLIRTYYLLGKFIGENYIGHEVKDWNN